MNKLLYIFFILLFFPFFSKAEVKIIDLHKNKSLDQLVLESNNTEEITENVTEEEQINQDDETNNSDLAIENNGQVDDVDNSEDKKADIENVTVVKSENILDVNKNIVTKHFSGISDIESQSLYREFVKILSNPQIDQEQADYDIIYHLIKKLYEIGEIGKAYNLIKVLDIHNLTNSEYISYFYFIELNYLFATFKLNEVCELKSALFDKSVTLPKFFLEKTDIFCLTLENKSAEAKLLNSLLLDSEIKKDENFQNLFNYMNSGEAENLLFNSSKIINFEELIFLYSAMLRINELALDEKFIDVDPLNLSIPVILSSSTKMDVRIKAANKAYYDEVINIDSLSALYQSVDFDSNQLNNPKDTIASLNNNKELIMPFYYQLVNIQIFPDQRLRVIIDYWEFAKTAGLEKIAYDTTKNIVKTFDLNSENTQFGLEIALAHISNKNFAEALKWINLYENLQINENKSDYLKFLIALNENNQLDTIINYLSENYDKLDKLKDQNTIETLEVLFNFLELEQSFYKNSYDLVLDSRLMPTYFLLKDLKQNIDSEKNISMFILSLISINNKKWTELHPDHLNLLLEVYKIYDQGNLLKPILLEILDELEIF
tara:strand:- start:3493 stop:5304 length:1812 start_codon:yes stop_codon:yes gene_type:complete